MMAGIGELLAPRSKVAGARAYRLVYHTAAIVGVAAIIADTQPGLDAGWDGTFVLLIWAATAVFLGDFAARILTTGRRTFGEWLTLTNAIDAVSALGIPLAVLAGMPVPEAYLFGLFWLLKLTRYVGGLETLGRVLRNAAEPLGSVLIGFLIVLIAAATLAYLAEGRAQPDAFGSIPRAMWWAIVTLTTTGYGDVTPHSFWGRFMAGVVMVCGIGVFGLWAGILASSFVDEMRRREFLRNWDLVAKAPLFSSLGADVIAEVARLLRRRDIGAGTVIMRRGDPGSSMFFIATGAVEVRIEPSPALLTDGDFFGEMALITGAPRSATVVAVRPCVLLELDLADFRALAGRVPRLTDAIYAEAERRRAPPASR